MESSSSKLTPFNKFFSRQNSVNINSSLTLILEKRDHAWQFNKNSDRTKPFVGRSFGNIESMCIEDRYQEFLRKGKPANLQILNLGKFSIDLNYLMLFLTFDRYNVQYHRAVRRGFNHIRSRNDLNTRFTVVIKLVERDGFDSENNQFNFLGYRWVQI